MRHSICLALGVSILAACSSSSSNDTGNDAGSGTTPDGGGTNADGGTTGDGGGTTSDGGSTADGSSSDSSVPQGDGGALASTCSTATLLAGNPVYVGDPSDRPTTGTGIKTGAPLPWSNLVFIGQTLYTAVEYEIWMTDLSAASPVETRVAGLADTSGGTTPFNDGPCATARFGGVHGLAALPDGSLVVADWWSNAILHITSPGTASCNVEYLAGNQTPSADEDTQVPSGDMDGPGAQALFNGPSALTTDDAGNVYVFDTNNLKLKKIGTDAQHTVSTLATLAADGPGALNNLTRIGSTIYGVGSSATAGFILGFDSTTGAMTTVLSGTAEVFPPLDTSESVVVDGITTDGTGLIVSGSGYLWYLTVGGTLTNLGGVGTVVDFPPDGYDPTAPQPASTFVFEYSEGDANGGSLTYVAYSEGSVYYRGHGDGTAYFIEKIACP